MPGFLPLRNEFDIEKIANLTYDKLQDAMIQKSNVTPNWEISATATALWLKWQLLHCLSSLDTVIQIVSFVQTN
jgi:hypothetical protein